MGPGTTGESLGYETKPGFHEACVTRRKSGSSCRWQKRLQGLPGRQELQWDPAGVSTEASEELERRVQHRPGLPPGAAGPADGLRRLGAEGPKVAEDPGDAGPPLGSGKGFMPSP